METGNATALGGPQDKAKEYQLTKMGHAVNLLNNHILRIGYPFDRDGSEPWREQVDAFHDGTPPEIREPLVKALSAAAHYLAARFNEEK